jgi:MFS superfamily sulfate permease-like transporter
VLRAYLRLVLFALGLLAGVQAPGLVDQYAKRVSAHYIEATKNFAGFQRTADLYFGGSVEALIAHHEASPDRVFKDEAKSVVVVYARVKQLALEQDAMSRSLISRIFHVAFQPDKEILDETIAAYSYTVPLNQEAILCGLIAALLLALLVESILIGILRLGQLALGTTRSSRA